MRNSPSNSQPPFWTERALAKLRDLSKRVKAAAGRPSPLYGLTIGVLAGISLLVGISLSPNPGKNSRKNEGQLSAATTPERKRKAAPAKAKQHRDPARTEKKQLPAEDESAEKKKDDPKKESEAVKFAALRSRGMEEVQLSPGAQAANGLQGEEEDSDTVRARASWFHDQRAYPFQHIPSGALQEAIRHRDLMKQQQRAKSGSQFGAQGIISFPGDALWHLMGPQPINELFSVNSGFPTASGRVTAIAVDPADTTGQTVYIGGAAGGVWKTANGGTAWTALTDTQPSLAIGSIAIDPNNHNTIYVGTGEENFSGDAYYGAGILKSTDGGTTWTQIGTSTFAQVLGPQTGGAFIGGIAVQPGNSNVVLASISFFFGGTIGGIYRSTDAGVTWTEVSGANAPIGIAATGVVFDPTPVASATGATVYAAMGYLYGQTANGIYKSIDSGVTWSKLTAGLPASGSNTGTGRIALALAPSTSGATAVLYAAIADASVSSNDLLGFFKTTNAGTSWTQLGSTPAFCNHQCWYDIAVGVSPGDPNFVVVGGGAFTNNSSSLFKSLDGGGTWTNSTPGTDFTLGTTSVRPHVDTHAFAFAANGAGLRLYVGNDGGMWRTDNPTPTPPLWVDLNATLAITQFYPGPSAGIGDENYGFGGTQDNDTEVFSGTLDWANVFACGDGGFTAIDPNIPTTVYTSCDRLANHVVRRSVFNGSIGPSQTFGIADTGIVTTDRMQFIPPLAIDESNPNTLYFGTCRLYQTRDGAATWNPISGDLSAGNASPTTCPAAGGNPTITAFDIAHQDSNIVLVGTSNGKVWETTTGGALWTQIDNGLLPNRHVTAVRTKRSDPTGQIAYATFSGFGSCAGCGSTPGHVFKTINGGATWTNISGDLPDAPVNDLIVFHQGNPNTFDALYIATDVGVFSCPDPEAATPCQNWTVLGDGLPNSPVLGLAMRRSSRILRAATHGRSMWNLQLTDVSVPPLAALSSVTPGAVNVGAPTSTVNIFGLNFSANTLVFFDGVSAGTPTFVDTTHLTVSVNSSFFLDGIVYQVSLTDPAGADPGSLPFTVMNPVLTPVTMTPSSTTVGTPVTLHFTGAGFVNSTSVNFNSFQLSGGTASAGGTVFDVPVPVFLLTAPATFNVTVTNPLPGGGVNLPNSFPFTINPNPNPLAIFNPQSIILGPIALGTTTPTLDVAITNPGGAALNITAQSITGANAANFSFAAPTSGTSCNFPTSGQSGTGTITLAANGGTCNFGITFTAGTPPGLANSTATLNVTDNGVGNPQHVPITGLVGPLAFLTGVNFGSVPVGTTSVTMNSSLSNIGGGVLNVTAPGFTISGTNSADFHLVPAVAGSNPPCPAVPFSLNPSSACDVGVTFTPSSPASVENATINVADNAVNLPQSAPLTGNGVQITSISPSIVATGGPAFTLTVNGGGFASSAVVNVNGSARLTTFVSANQLQASIPASDIVTAGSLAITVTTPVPGGTPSEPKTLVVAQAPQATNDNINFATNAGVTPFRATQDTTQATINTAGVNDPTPACTPGGATQAGKARSVWFKFVAPSNGRVIADTRFSSYTTILSAWTGTPGSLVAVASACNSGNVPGTTPQSFIGFNATNATTYFVMVTDASAGGLGGTLTFSLDFQSTAPANDDNLTPTIIAAAPFSNSVNTIQATPNTNAHADPALPGGCATGAASSGQANSVWYRFTAPGNGSITADTLTSPYDTVLNVTSGSPAGTQVACNNDAAAGIAQSQVSFAATSGTQYFFMVSSFLGDGGTTNFHLTFSVVTAPAVAFSPTNIAFGNQMVNTASATTDLTITNSGSAQLNITSITLTGTDPTQFTLGAPTTGTACPLGASSLAAGISCKVGVKFNPTTTGAKSANVSVADNASGSPHTAPLTGTGAVPVAALAPANIAFGNQTIATSSATSDVTVSNTGLVSMSITSITLTGTDPTQFTLGAPTSGTACPLGASTLNAGANCKVGVKFAPTTLGAKSANVSVADDAAGTPQTVPLTGTSVSGPAPAVTLNPTSLAFGNQKVGTTSAVLSATLTNTGNANLNITAVSITGTNVADFTSSGTTCTNTTVLAQNGTCALGATFSPGAQGARSAAFTISDNASGSPHSLPMSGTGTVPGVGLAPANIAFGNLPVNTTSATTDVTLTNSGAATLNITSIALTGTDPTQFTLGAPTSGTPCPLGASTLNAGANCKVGLKFAPTSTGAKSASVSFADDATGSPQTVPLAGTGTAPGATLGPANIAFGNQRTGTSSATNDVTITNSGTATLNITSITLAGTDPTQFTLGAPTSGTACPLGASTLNSGANCKVGVKFAPTTTGAKSANVSVADDATGSPQTVPLTGTGTAPGVTLAPANIAFGNQPITTSSATTDVTITNSGTATLNITSITLTGTDPTQFTLGAPTSGTACPVGASTLAAGANCKMGVKFAPTTTGAKSANVSVADDATGSPQTVPLTGTGTAPAVALAPANIAFGNQPITASSATTDVTITNSGTGTLNITSITLTGTDPTQFTLGAPTSGTACPLGASTLNSGANCKVGLKFAPTTTGNKSANMSVADDATGSPQTVPLTGTGTTATVALTPSPVNFPNTRKGTISATLNVTLTNSGGADVHLNGGTPITITGANAGDFAVVAPSVAGTPCAAGGTVVKSGGSCLIGVQFTPSTAAAETATLNVADDAVGSPQTDVLNGTGIFPAVTITPNPLAFGNQFVAAASAPLTATLKNTGTDTLNLAAANAVLLGGTNSGDFAIAAGTTCASSAVIAVNGTCLINVTFTPAVAGARSATITVTDDVAPAQVLNLTGTGDTPASVTATAGTPQSAAINAAFATALQATVKDAGGNVLAGVTVTFTAPSSGASGVFTGSGTATANVTTNASGVATAPTFTANGTAGGPYTVAATVSGVAAPANFSLTNLAGPAASITATAGTPQSVVINNAFAALKATVKDAGGNLVSGVTVTFTAPSTGASGTFAGGAATANVATDASGVATAPTFTANSAAGSYTVTATVPGVGTPANFQLSNLPGVPSITSLSPTSATAGGAAFTLTVNGTNIVATSVVNFNGAAKVTTFKTSTQLTAAITAADILSAGVVNVTVTTPAPGGGTSAAASFTINNVQPVLSTLSPTNTLAGGAAFTLTITGSGFVSGATVNFGNNPALTPSSIAATQIQVTVPAADIATAGNVLVTVTNPAPSVGPSVPATFTVNNPVPTVTNAAVSGKNHAAGGTAFTLTVTGTNFVSTSTVNFSGKAEPTTFVSATQVTAAIPASDVANAGNVNVTVTNPGPGGGTSTSPFAFTLDGFGVSAPATTTVKAGSQATITVTVTPTANGFTSTTPISFAVTGLPIRTTSAFNPATVVPGNATVTTTLTITTEANSAVPPSSPIDWPTSPVLRFLPVIWLAMLLAGLYAMSLIRRNPQRPLRRYAAIVPLALLLFTGAMLAACSGALHGTPTGPAPLKITATSGTLSQTANVTLTVQ